MRKSIGKKESFTAVFFLRILRESLSVKRFYYGTKFCAAKFFQQVLCKYILENKHSKLITESDSNVTRLVFNVLSFLDIWHFVSRA